MISLERLRGRLQIYPILDKAQFSISPIFQPTDKFSSGRNNPHQYVNLITFDVLRVPHTYKFSSDISVLTQCSYSIQCSDTAL